jgi:hypothetical protein
MVWLRQRCLPSARHHWAGKSVAPVAHADLHFAPQVDNQSSLCQRVEIHVRSAENRVSRPARRINAPNSACFNAYFFNMAAIRSSVNTVDAHTTPSRVASGNRMLLDLVQSRETFSAVIGSSNS